MKTQCENYLQMASVEDYGKGSERREKGKKKVHEGCRKRADCMDRRGQFMILYYEFVCAYG